MVHGTFVRYDDRYDGTEIVVQLCNGFKKLLKYDHHIVQRLLNGEM